MTTPLRARRSPRAFQFAHLLTFSILLTVPALAQRLEPHPPVVCGGNEDVEIRGKLIETDGNAVTVTGHCDVVIRDSRIVAGGYAVVATNHGEVEIRDSHVEGGKGGLVAIDHGEISYRDSTVRGGVAGGGRHAELEDEGGNEVSGRVAEIPSTHVILQGGSVKVTTSGVSTPSVEVDASGVRVGGAGGVSVDERGIRVGAGPASVSVDEQGVRVGAGQASVSIDAQGVRVGTGGAAVQLRAGTPLVCNKNARLVIEGQDIVTDGEGVAVLANCTVTIRNSRIIADGYAVLNTASGIIEIENSHIEGRLGGILLSGNGTVRYRSTVVRGGALSTAKGTLADQGDNQVTGTVDLSGLGDAIVRAASGSSASVAPPPAASRDAIRVDAGGVQVGDIEVTAAGIRIGQELLALETVGDFVRLEAAGAAIDAAWRSRASTYSAADTVRLMDELGARVEGGVTHVDLAGDVLFDFGSAAVRPDAAAQLVKVAHVLRQKAQSEVQVVGHTDSVGSDQANQKLSEARAIAVMAWLNQHQGIPANLIKARGLGEKQPVAHNTKPDGSDDPAGRARNRRVEIVF
jgi:outer membrane protein OmpA-like peptidoglycan-associated protein